MKKLLLLTSLLICLFVQAQNQTIINKMVESKSIDEIKFVSDQLVSQCKEHYDFYKVAPFGNREDESYQYVIYTKQGMSEQEKKEIYPNFNNCIVVKFKQWNKGENKDLEVKGELVYYFKEVSGKYLDVAPFWIDTFFPSATIASIIDDYKLKEYRVNKDLKYKLVKNENLWIISKSY